MPQFIYSAVSNRLSSKRISTVLHENALQIITDISSRVSDRNATEPPSSDELLHVTCHRLYPRSRHAGGYIIDNLITREEKESIRIFRELFDGGKDVLEIHMVVGRSGLVLAYRIFWGIDVQRQINAGTSKSIHTICMIHTIVDSVDANSVDLEFLEPVEFL